MIGGGGGQVDNLPKSRMVNLPKKSVFWEVFTRNRGGGGILAPVGARKFLGVQRSGHTLKNESRLEKSRK